MYKRLQDTLPESRKLGRVSDFAFRCWTVALAKADWFGRLTAEPDKFRITCFANRSSVTDSEVMSALDELADANAIHLYRIPEGRFLLIHRHEEHNPTGGLKTRPVRCPPPPAGLCRCGRYKQGEVPKAIQGSTFRFFQGLFSTDQQPGSAPLCSSPLLSSKVGGCGGKEETVETASSAVEDLPEGTLAKLTDEFTSLTGRVPLAAVADPTELLDRLKGLIRVRGLEPMLAVMRAKTSDCIQRTGRAPSSLQYFVPIFEDDRAFNGKGSRNDGAQKVVQHFALRPGKLGETVERRIAEREGAGTGPGKKGGAPGGGGKKNP